MECIMQHAAVFILETVVPMLHPALYSLYFDNQDMSNYTTTVGPRPRPAGRPPQPRPSAVTNPNTLSWVTYSPHDRPGPSTAQPLGLPTPVQSSRPLPNPYPPPLRVVNTSEPQNLDDDEDGERLDPNAFSPQYPNLAGPSSRLPPQKKPTLIGGLMKGFTNFPKKMFSRSGSTHSDSDHSFPTRRPTVGADNPIPPLPMTSNGAQMPSKPMPQSRYLPKPPPQPQFVQPSQPMKPLPSSISDLSSNTLLLRTYPQAPLSEIPEVESNAPSPPPQVVRLSNSENPNPRPRQNSIRRVPPPPVTDPAEEAHEEQHHDDTGPTVPRITIMDFNEGRNTQYPNDQSLVGHDEPTSPEETMPGGLPTHPSHGQTLSYVSSDYDKQQGAPVYPMLPPPIRSPSPPNIDAPSSPDIRSASPARSPSPLRAEPNPNPRPPTGILFRPQTISNTRSDTPPPPSLIPGNNRLSIETPFPLHQALSEDYDEHQPQHPTMLFTTLPPMTGIHEPDDLLSPISVSPQPADDYRVMTTMSPEPLATVTGTTLTGTSYYRSDRSYSTNLNPIERFFKRLYNMPWISRDRVTVDYLPGEQEKGGKIRPKKTKPMSSWYHAVLGRTKRSSNSNSLDLLTTGSGSARDRDRDRRHKDERDDRGRTRTKEKRRHHHHESSTRDKEKHHKHHHHHHSSSRHRHHHHDHHDHHHRHHSGSRHSKRRRTTSTVDDEVERMKGMPPMPVYPFPYPPFPIPGLPGFPMPVVATTDDGETLALSPPKLEGQPDGAHHERPRTRSQPMGAAFGVYAPPGYQPYQGLVAPGAPPMYMFTPQQMGVNVKQAAAGTVEHPHPKIEPVTSSPAAPVAQTLAAAAAAEEKAKEGQSVPGSFA
ncbi:hypothetical protein BJ165DRAFT_1594782 [Panaeolus papilionaceus]|nr:hypothetical protein BJ165DRAFT_1594782 [Panaeolus papilionaceus]